MKLYLYLKQMASHDLTRNVPLYSYKTMLNDKNTHIKLEFIQ